VKNFNRISKRFSDSFNRMLGILLLSIGLAGLALPGMSQAPSPGIKGSNDSADISRTVASSPAHRTGAVRAPASQSPSASAGSVDTAKNAPASASSGTAPQQSAPQGPKIWLKDTQRVATSFTGTTRPTRKGFPTIDDTSLAQNNALAMLIGAGQAQSVSIVKGDLDGDGIEDLVVGYSTAMGPAVALYRGNLDAFAPQSKASFDAIGRGEFPSPFLPEARVFSAPVTPNFVVTGNFTPNGFQDILIASRGGNALYLLPGDGKGNFGPPQKISISGSVNALATGEFGSRSQGTNLPG
jgi:hypothetical protein